MEFNTATEQKILNAAAEVFGEKGHAGARMQEIADKAGINKALLHYYFRSKDKLFHIVFKREMRVMLENIFSAISPADSFREFIQKFIHTYLTNISSRKNIMRFVIWELDYASEELAETFYEVFQSFGFSGNPIILRIEEAISKKEIRPIDSKSFILNLLGMCIFPFVAAPLLVQILPGFNPENPHFIDERERAILEVIMKDIEIRD